MKLKGMLYLFHLVGHVLGISSIFTGLLHVFILWIYYSTCIVKFYSTGLFLVVYKLL